MHCSRNPRALQIVVAGACVCALLSLAGCSSASDAGGEDAAGGADPALLEAND